MSTRAVHLIRRWGALVLVLLFATTAAAQRWDSVEQIFVVEADGTISVVDTRKVSGTNYKSVSLCVYHPDTAVITVQSEYTGFITPAGAARVTERPCAFGTEIIVTLDEYVDEYTSQIQFVYTIGNAISFHEDVAEWRWRILEPAGEIVWDYEANIVFPGVVPSPFGVFVHNYTLLGEPETTWLGIRREFSVEKFAVMPDDAYDIRVLMPPRLFNERGTGRALQALLSDEDTYKELNSVLAPLLQVDDLGDVPFQERFMITGKTSQLSYMQPVTVQAQIGSDKPTKCQIGQGGVFSCSLTHDQVGPAEVIVSAIDNGNQRTQRLVRFTVLPDPNAPKPPLARAEAIILYTAIGYFAFVIFGLISSFAKTKRPRTPNTLGNVFTPPPGVRPQYAELQFMRSPTQAALQRALLAILIDLTRRGHLTFSQDGKTLALALHPIPDQSFVQSELLVIEYFAQHADDRGIIAGPVFARLLRMSGRHLALKLRPALLGEMKHFEVQVALRESLQRRGNTWTVLTLVGMFGWAVAAILVDPDYVLIPIAAAMGSMFLSLIAGFILPLFGASVSEEEQHWKAYIATLKTPAAYGTAPREFFAQWDRHLAYATAGGAGTTLPFLLLRAEGLPERAMVEQAQWLRRFGLLETGDLPALLNGFGISYLFLSTAINGRSAQLLTLPPLGK